MFAPVASGVERALGRSEVKVVGWGGGACGGYVCRGGGGNEVSGAKSFEKGFFEA